MSFNKSLEYIETIYNFMETLLEKAKKLKDNKLMSISKLIFNYLISCCSEKNVLIRDLNKKQDFNMISINEYITNNKIELYDLLNINFEDVNINNSQDIERFVLSHIIYIYENNK